MILSLSQIGELRWARQEFEYSDWLISPTSSPSFWPQVQEEIACYMSEDLFGTVVAADGSYLVHPHDLKWTDGRDDDRGVHLRIYQWNPPEPSKRVSPSGWDTELRCWRYGRS